VIALSIHQLSTTSTLIKTHDGTSYYTVSEV
jgi:hypothetical protein